MLQLDFCELATVPGDNANRERLAERRLVTAVLRQALDDLNDHRFGTDPNARRIFDSAMGWIFSTREDDGDDHLSFLRVCDLLALDPSYLRRLVRKTFAPEPEPSLRRSAA
jgi:hypothetical protein